MKNISLALNALLIIAVGFLYYLHFSGTKKTASETETSTDTSKVKLDVKPTEIKNYPIVYVNGDSLYEEYEYVKEIKKDLLARQKNMEAAYQSQVADFQKKYYELQQRAQAGQINQDVAKVEEEALGKQKSYIDGLEKNLGKLQEEIAQKNQGITVLISEFLERYNKEGHYKYILAYTSISGSLLFADKNLDITNEVVAGLNAEYNAQKNKK